VPILLVAIGAYVIGGYLIIGCQCLLYWLLLWVTLLVAIGGYFISGYWLFYYKLLLDILAYW